ncbi:DNA glycosylase [Lactarius sanguifluus]|nr:DNA glycosylase [Lactarius sanguifluus]
MPVTRSATRARAAASAAQSLPVANAKRPPKRQDSVVTKRPQKATKVGADEGVPRPLIPPSGEELAPLPAELTFSLEDAKNHLIQADYRFGDVLSRLPCTPFERVEAIHPFHGQQISWMAARAIQHKFLRLYFPELPEKPDEQYWAKTRQEVFPTAYQVATTDLAILKTAGLSGRKAEYVRDLATRFADGRLTNQKLLDANDEQLFELLTAVYGIGKMFAIFSLRRPDILPLNSRRRSWRATWPPSLGIITTPARVPHRGVTEEAPRPFRRARQRPRAALNPNQRPAKSKKLKNKPIEPDQESEPPTLNGRLRRAPIPPLPAGLTINYLTDRLKGKKQGPILTPTQMEELTESWRPYRSIGVYYMWALAEEKAGS